MEPSPLRISYFGCDPATAAALESALGRIPHTAHPIEDFARWLAAPTLDTDLLVIGPDAKDAVKNAQQAHLREPGFDVVMLVPPDRLETTQARATLAPYLTRRDTFHSADDIADCAWFRDYAERILAARRSRGALKRAHHEMAGEKERQGFGDIRF